MRTHWRNFLTATYLLVAAFFLLRLPYDEPGTWNRWVAYDFIWRLRVANYPIEYGRVLLTQLSLAAVFGAAYLLLRTLPPRSPK
jgi:hypothetical protein